MGDIWDGLELLKLYNLKRVDVALKVENPLDGWGHPYIYIYLIIC